MIEHRMEWQARLIEWLAPRLSGTDDDKAQALDIMLASLSESYNTGIDDAADVVERLGAARPTRELSVAGKALRDLAALNRRAD